MCILHCTLIHIQTLYDTGILIVKHEIPATNVLLADVLTTCEAQYLDFKHGAVQLRHSAISGPTVDYYHP
jgi:hypothetical protein